MSQRKVCFFFNTPAGCRRGPDCNWLHDPGSASTPSTPSPSTPRGPSNPNLNAPNGVCRFFWIYGNCRFADCRFSHVRQGDSPSSTTPTITPALPRSSTAPHPPTPAPPLKFGGARYQLLNVFLSPTYKFTSPATINRFVNILASCSSANEWVRSFRWSDSPIDRAMLTILQDQGGLE